MRTMAIQVIRFILLEFIALGMTEKDVVDAAHLAVSQILEPPHPSEDDHDT